ncbi:hypothetical protein [Roseobacter sp.]|uniref:hypothetical protein n=1 Tax=Roseobacter sp. TaxID=1907202 RepID=UPI00385BC44B
MSAKSEAELAQEILKRTALYLDKLAGHVFDIEETVGNSIAAKEASDEETIKNLQVLDFLRQSMEDLALMAIILSDPKTRPLDEETVKAASSKLRLKSTRLVLCDIQSERVDTLQENTGDIDLF